MTRFRFLLLTALLCGVAHSAAAQSELSIDVPSAGAIAHTRTIAGQAIADVTYPYGDAVDAVHVWAFPDGEPDAVFLGAATIHLQRVDVALAFGWQDVLAGWSLTADVRQIHPGRYTFCAFVHSMLTGTFVAAQCVNAIMFFDDPAYDELYLNPDIASSVDAFPIVGTQMYPQGWAAADSNVYEGSGVTGEFLLDDNGLAYGQLYWTNTAYRPDVCEHVYVGHCAPLRSTATTVTPSDVAWTGVQTHGIDISGLAHGYWHTVRIWTWPIGSMHASGSKWRWFWIE